MDRTIKTRRMIKDIKTTAHQVSMASAKEVAVKTREAAHSVVPTPNGPEEDDAPSRNRVSVTKGSSLAQGVVRKGRAYARDSQIRRRVEEGGQSKNPSSQDPKKHPHTPDTREAKRKACTNAKKPAAPSKPPKTPSAPQHARSKSSETSQPISKTTRPNLLKARARKSGFTRLTPSTAPKMEKAADGVKSFARMASASARSLSAAMTALGGTAVSVVVVVLLAAFVASSAFGIFFTGGDMGDGCPTLRECIAKLDAEHTAHIETIKTDNPHNRLVVEGSKASWKEILAVFAVKITTDTDDPFDAITFDEDRQRLLRSTYWDMNRIENRMEERRLNEIVLEKDENGNEVKSTKTTSERILHIELSHSSADEAASVYGFVGTQINLLHQLLDGKNDSLWQTVLYGAGQGSADIVEVARAQLGNVGGQPYWSWYGFSGRVEWCACFVSWCANECSLIEDGSIPKFAYCPSGIRWFKDAGRWRERGYEPQPGDIIFFDWQNDGVSDHVGIVEFCDGPTIHTIEGNSGDECKRNIYNANSASIIGYGAY